MNIMERKGKPSKMTRMCVPYGAGRITQHRMTGVSKRRAKKLFNEVMREIA